MYNRGKGTRVQPLGESRNEFENAMKRFEQQLLDHAGSLIHRLWWVALLSVHLHPLISTMRGMVLEGVSPSRLMAMFVLLLLMTFFILKIINVSFLRHHARREALIVFWIVAALVHNNAATVALEAASAQPLPVAVLAGISVAGVGASTWKPNRASTTHFLKRIYDGLIARGPMVTPSYRLTILESLGGHRLYDRPCHCALRAPPVSFA